MRVSKKVLSFAVFFFFVALLALSLFLTNKPPEIYKLTPSAALPGEKIEITGKNFGNKQEGSGVIIAGIKPTLSSYISWNSHKIVLTVPDDVKSGRLYVQTESGLSNGPLFINKEYIPVVVDGPAKPGLPYIQNISPVKGRVGQKVTIEGLNFGFSQGAGTVSFSFYSGKEAGGADYIRCSPLDFDYLSWDSQKVVVHVPDGATSGEIKISTDRGDSNSLYFEVVNPVGTKRYDKKRGFQIQYDVSVSDIVVAQGKKSEFELWVPGVQRNKAQRNMEAVFDPEPMWKNYKGLMMYQIKSIDPWRVYKFTQSYWFERYAIETDINAQRVIRRYDTSRKLYSYYTAANSLIPADNKKIRSVASSLTRRESNPYVKARKIYTYLLRRLEYSGKSPFMTPLESLEKKKGDAFDYAILFTALCRSAGVPARTVAGYLVYGDKQTRKHWWSEFYLEGFGWVPVDAALGDGMDIVGIKIPKNPEGYYFGNVDNQRITFSKGVIDIKPINPDGKTVRKVRSYSLQTVQEEYSDTIKSYKSRWDDIQVIDWW